MFKTNRLYKIITARNGCKGIESAIVKYLGDCTDIECRGLYDYDKDTCVVRVVFLNDAWGKTGDVWRINKDCEYEELKGMETTKPSWKNTLNCKNIFPLDFYKCIDIANSINYPFICFNGFIYSTLDANYTIKIGNESELGE